MKGIMEEMEEIGFDESCERTWTSEGKELGVGVGVGVGVDVGGPGLASRTRDEERV